MNLDDTALLQELRQDQMRREFWLKWCARNPAAVARKQFYELVQHLAAAKLESRFGVPVIGQGYHSPFDLTMAGVKIEVKASHWQTAARRYQAEIRHAGADVVLFDCVNGTHHWFIIPMAALAGRRTLEIYSYNVQNYRGQWSRYLGAWDLLLELIINSENKPKQLRIGV